MEVDRKGGGERKRQRGTHEQKEGKREVNRQIDRQTDEIKCSYSLVSMSINLQFLVGPCVLILYIYLHFPEYFS